MRIAIAPDHPCFAGHFPNYPILPGVLVLERVLAQAESLLGSPLQAISLLNVKFLAPVLPGNELEVVFASVSPSDHRFTVQVFGSIGEPTVACTGQLRVK